MKVVSRSFFFHLLPIMIYPACSIPEDTGTLCQGTQYSYSSTLITGEASVLVELDTVNPNDPNCQTFNCLTADGVPPYCSRSCRVHAATNKANACQQDSDCQSPLQCSSNRCVSDDCPSGFWCKTVQNIGQNKNSLYCKRRLNCTSDVDCGDITRFSCGSFACYAQCPQINNLSCNSPFSICSPQSSLHCSCTQSQQPCPDNELNCSPTDSSNSGQTWPTGSFRQANICYPK